MFKRTLVLTAVSTFVFLAPAGAMAQDLADPDSTAQGDVSVTIYNDDQALVQDVRQLSIASGRSQISFPDVSAQIRAETLSFNAADTAIVVDKLCENSSGQHALRAIGDEDRAAIGSADGQDAALRHGVARIHRQVHNHLLDLAGVHAHTPESRR